MTLRRLDHVLVLTDDLETTVSFYRDALGLEPGPRPPLPFPGHWLYLDDTPCLHVAERAPYEAHAANVGLAPTSTSIDHVAFAADGYDGIAARLAVTGVEAVTNDVPDAAMRQIFLTDPNGVRIELNVAD
jgi:catechol 2,3-dioxygenase-like lactoylglutathione lyase family enzyme